MSYDLYLRPRRGSMSHDRFREHFGSRANYTVDGDAAGYQNPDTGVYFTFDYLRPGTLSDPDAPREMADSTLAFNINYLRPSCFAREAEPELARLVRALDLVVHDPQIDGMGDGEYDADGFLRGWDAGNRIGYTRAPRDVIDFVKSLAPGPRSHEALSTDKVLDAELVALNS